MQLSVKSPSGWMWKTGYTHQKIEADLAAARLSAEWQVCPLGEADKAISLEEYLLKPDVFGPTASISAKPVAPPTSPSGPGPLSPMAIGWLVLGTSLIARYGLAWIASNPPRGRPNKELLLLLSTLSDLALAGIYGGVFTILAGYVWKVNAALKPQE